MKTKQKIAISPPLDLTFFNIASLPYSVSLSLIPAFSLIFSYPFSGASVTSPQTSLYLHTFSNTHTLDVDMR